MSMRAVTMAAALAASVLAAAPVPAQEPIKIGALAPYTGNLAWYGQELGRGYELAVKRLNAAGGVAGRQLQIVKADAPTAVAAVGEVERLKNQGVNVVIGSGFSAAAMTASAASERNGMVYWETNGLENSITTRNLKLTFQVGPNNDNFSEASITMFEQLAPGMIGKPLKDITVALVYENSTYGVGLSKVQKAKLTQLGIKVVLDQSYSRTASDLSPVVLQMRSANPDVVIETGYQDDIVLLWRQAKELSYLPKMLISSGAAATQDFANALGPAGVEGFIAYNYPFHDMPEAGAPGAAEFAKDYAAAFGAPPPSGHSLAAYAGMLILGDALQGAKGDNPQEVAKVALAMDKPVGTYPNGAGVKFTPTGRNDRASAHGFQWQGGTMYTIWPAPVSNGKAMGPLVPWDKRPKG